MGVEAARVEAARVEAARVEDCIGPESEYADFTIEFVDGGLKFEAQNDGKGAKVTQNNKIKPKGWEYVFPKNYCLKTIELSDSKKNELLSFLEIMELLKSTPLPV